MPLTETKQQVKNAVESMGTYIELNAYLNSLK